MNSFIDVYNKLIEDKILFPEQFEDVNEDGFLIHINKEYMMTVSEDYICLLRNWRNPLRHKEMHTHQRDDCLYEDTYEIVKRYSGNPKAIFRERAISEIKQIIISIIIVLLIYSVYAVVTK